MNEVFYKYYIDILKNIATLTIFKKKKSTISIKDGFLSFNINLKNLNECQCCGKFKMCDYRKCKHIYFILVDYYKLTYNDLFFLWKNNNYEKLLKNETFDYSEEECSVCIDSIFYNKQKYVHCLNCGVCYHSKCINKCKDTKCLNCMQLIY